jgi:hypothetical protein
MMDPAAVRAATGRCFRGPSQGLPLGRVGPIRCAAIAADEGNAAVGETRVDFLHLLEDLRDAYPGSIEETILTEIVANSLDSGATRVDLRTDAAAGTLAVVDDGSGMRRRGSPATTTSRPARRRAAKGSASRGSASSSASSSATR